jgi:hypothetical protein
MISEYRDYHSRLPVLLKWNRNHDWHQTRTHDSLRTQSYQIIPFDILQFILLDATTDLNPTVGIMKVNRQKEQIRKREDDGQRGEGKHSTKNRIPPRNLMLSYVIQS